MTDLGKTLITLGAVIALIGLFLILSGKMPWLGRLPGDIYIKRDNFSFSFPLTTCIILSAAISFILWLFRK
jgi:ribose/xylose/arabinose/galactoside ABC-type transport system permease subunit